MADRCPTCGSRVRVVASDEGTAYFHPEQTRSGTRWTNAVITLTVPLDGLDNSAEAKQDAVADVLSRVIEALPENLGQFVGSATWEDVSDA